MGVPVLILYTTTSRGWRERDRGERREEGREKREKREEREEGGRDEEKRTQAWVSDRRGGSNTLPTASEPSTPTVESRLPGTITLELSCLPTS